MDYGISSWIDGNETTIYHPNCSVLFRVRPFSLDRGDKTFTRYEVETANFDNGENEWTKIFAFDTEKEATDAMHKLVHFIYDEAEAAYLRKEFLETLSALLAAAKKASNKDFAELTAGARGADEVYDLYEAADKFIKVYSAKLSTL